MAVVAFTPLSPEVATGPLRHVALEIHRAPSARLPAGAPTGSNNRRRPSLNAILRVGRPAR
jgi:hypothetical protein